MAGTAVAAVMAVDTAGAQGVQPAQVQPTSAGTAASAQNLNIPPQPLASALVAFSRQTRIEIFFDQALATGKQSPGVSGALAPSAALNRLLAGSGLRYRFTNANTVIIDPPVAAATAAAGPNAGVPAGAIQLDPVEVAGTRSRPEDRPYQTPGSTAYISREELDRVPATSAGDVFRTTPGVISAGNRVGASINPNIRGLQGMGRVNTTVDGARQTTSSYRGYVGNRDETYVDPDMIGGIDISKGPSDGAGVGGIGGSVNFRTLEAGDIVKDGKTFGTRFKGSLGSNTVAARAAGASAGEERPGFFNGDTYSGSLAVATIQDAYEFVTAYSKRQQGNYFVGTKVPAGVVFGNSMAHTNATVGPGQEVFNTSENTESLLLKGKAKWGDGQSLELGYVYYGSRYGEIDELNFAPWLPQKQHPLSETRVHTYTAKYNYRPSDNPYVNLRANLWFSDVASERKFGLLAGPYGVRTTGGDVGNASVFATPLGELTVDNGLEFVREHAEAVQFPWAGPGGWMTYGPSGERLMTSAFSKASLKATDWLTLSAGARFDHFESEGEGYLSRYPALSGSRLSPNLGVVLTPFDGIQLYGRYTEGYRPPSLRESHWHYQELLQNNPNLRPEIAKNTEFGLNVQRNDLALPGDKLRLKLSYFDNRYDDYIVRARIPTTDNYRWDNIDHATYRGFEISGGYDAGSFFVEGAFTKYLSIEYCRTAATCSSQAVENDYVANYVPPKHAGSLTAGIRAFEQALTLGVRTHFASERTGSKGFGGGGIYLGTEQTWPKYQILDLFGSYKLTKDTVINASVENVFDRYYFGALSSIGIASPGRTVRVGLTTSLDGPLPVPQNWPFDRLAKKAAGHADWTGFYLGGHWEYARANDGRRMVSLTGASDAKAAHETADHAHSDALRGLQGGFNYQFDNRLVLGLEGDFSWLGYKNARETLATEGANLRAGQLESRLDSNVHWLATLRGRVGYAANDSLLLYLTGGAAFLRQSEQRTQFRLPTATSVETIAAFSETASATRVGVALGAGAEYAIGGGWSVKAEYLFAGLPEKEFTFQNARAGVSPDTTTTTGGEFNPARPGCNFANPQTCFNPIIVTTTPGSFPKVTGRKLMSSVDIQMVKIGVNYRF